MTEIEPYAGGAQIVTRQDLRNSATDSWTDVLEEIGDLASRIAGTDFVPETFRGSVPAVAATILTGRELGFAPMTALASLHSIKGKVGLSAEAMRALVLQAGHEIVTTTSTASQCTMKGRRSGSQEWTEVTWTSSDARQAKLTGENWTKYPRAMLQARASSELCRLAFPDIIRGLASLEEITDYDVLPGGAPAPAGDDSEATKPTPVKRAPRKRATAPKAEPADPPALPDGDTAEAPEAPTQADDPPAPDLPDSSPSAEPESADVAEESQPRDAHPGDSAGEAPAEGEAPDLPDPDVDESTAVEDPDVEDVAGEFDRMPANQGQIQLVIVHFNRLGIKDRDQRLMMTCAIIGRIIESANALTFKEATALLHVLETAKDADALAALIEATTNDGA